MESQLHGDGADAIDGPSSRNHRRGRRGGARQRSKNQTSNDLAERETRDQAKRIAEVARIEAELREDEERIQRQERARRAEAERKKEAERLAREKEAEEAVKRRQAQIQTQRAKEAAFVEQYVVLDSSLVTCRAGLDIWHVVTGFDLCKVTIKNLPRDTQRAEIAGIFLHHGIPQTEFFISQLKFDEAVVLANAEHSQAIAYGLEGTLLRNEILKFSVSASGNGMDAAKHNSPFVHIYWRAPSEALTATYGTMAEARDKVQKLDMAIWRDRKISAVMNDPPRDARGVQKYVAPSVRITGLPSGVQSMDADLIEFTGTRNLRMWKPIIFDLPRSFQIIRELLATYPGVRINTYEILDSGEHVSGEAKVKVLFDEWEDAKNAYAAIRNMRSPANSAQFRSWFPPSPLQYSMQIPRAQYEAQKKQWDALSEKKPGSDTHVQPKIGERGDVVFLRVLGHDKKAAGPLKVRVENMVAGDKLDATYWHSSFGSPSGRGFFDRIYKEKKVFVRNDFKTRSLKVYGEPHPIQEVCEMIKSEVERLSKSETTRILDQRSIGFFVREGLGKLTELLGEGNVALNLASRPCKITIKGGEEAIHHLQRLIDESRDTNSLGALLPGSAEREVCPICTDDVSNPEQLGCGHTYCAGCLKHVLMSAAETKNFPLVCMASDATCDVPISIPFIQRFLPGPIFESLVEAAFLFYLDQHPQELKYCTTPDCKQIYRRRTDPTSLQCPSCFLSICAACGEDGHEGMTCQQHRFHKNPDAEHERLNGQLASAHGYKKCPQCKVWIEKNGGCDHMECRCGAHICWICMVMFDRENIHKHMENVHGNRFDELSPEVNLGNVADEMSMIERLRNGARQSSSASYSANWVDSDSDEEMPGYDWVMERYRQQLEQQRRLAEDARLAEERRIAERRRLEQERLVTYQRRMAEEARAAEEARRLAQRRRLEQERMVAYQRRIAEEARAEEEARRLAERRKLESEERMAAYRRQVAESVRQEEGRRRAEYERLLKERRKREEKKDSWCIVM